MDIIYLEKDQRETTPSVATIGFFDGVHRGHRHLLRLLTDDRRRLGLVSTVLTFRQHPRQVVQPGWCPQLLTTFEEKLQQLAGTGVDRCVVLPFDRQMAALSARDFMAEVLSKRLGVRRLYVGHDHRFGHDRREGFADYANYGRSLHMEVLQADALCHEDTGISSSLVRQLLHEGRAAQAADCLGRPYQLGGTVVGGRQVGRRLGFPTANLQPHDPLKLVPAPGVYAVAVRLPDGQALRPGMLNIGNRPTFGASGQTIEAHLLDFEGRLYGQNIVVCFLERLRDERRFDDAEQLRQQLQADAEAARRVFDEWAARSKGADAQHQEKKKDLL